MARRARPSPTLPSPSNGDAHDASAAAVARGGGAPASRRALIVGPPGSGKTSALLDRFLAALRREGTERTLLVLPTYGEVEHGKRMLVSRRDAARRLDGVLDAAFATFTSLGERLDPTWRVGHLPTRLERDLWAGGSLASVPALAEASRQPGMRARFLRLVKELKQTGDEPDVVRARAREAAAALEAPSAARLLAFLDAWAAYDARLAAGHARDHEDALRDLVGAVAGRVAGGVREAASRIAFLAVDGFEDLTGVETRLLDALVDAVTGAGGEAVVTLPVDATRPGLFVHAARLAARLESRGFARETLPELRRAQAAPLRALANRLFLERGGGDDAHPLVAVHPGAAIRSIVGVDPADEWDRIGREVRRLVRDERGVVSGFKDVGIVVRRLDDGGADARRALERLGIPVRVVSGGARLSTEPVARAVRGPLRVVAGDDGREGRDFEPGWLLDYLRWRALASGKPLAVEPVDRAEMEWRDRGDPGDLDRFAAAFRGRGRPFDEVFRDLDALRVGSASPRGPEAWARARFALDALLPLPASEGVGDDGAPRDPEGDAALARAAAAKASLERICLDAAEAVRRTGVGADATFSDVVRDLFEAAARTVSSPPDRRLDAVSVLDAEEARHWELPVVFVAGLVDDAFPLRPREDVFVRDDDRLALRERLHGDPADPAAGAWRTAREAEDGERRLFLWSVTRASERLYLCRHALDESGRAAAPSPFFREVDAALGPVAPSASGGGDERPEGLSRGPDDLARRCVPPAEALCDLDLLRFVADRSSAAFLAVPEGAADRRLARALLRTGGDVPARVAARAGRFRRPTEDALPASASVLAAFREATRSLSPKWLTAGRSCLHRFFLGRVAKVPTEDVPVTGIAYDRRDLGEMLHAALHHAVRAPERAAESIAEEVVGEHDGARLDGATRDAVVDEVARVVRLFRAREAAAAGSGFVPAVADLELEFGGEGSEVRVGAGEGAFSLRGRVDRIDRRGDLAIVVDYKTGPSSAKEGAQRTRVLDDLQLPLYAEAVARLRGVRVVALEHYAARRRERYATCDEAFEDVMEARCENGRCDAVGPVPFAGLLRLALEAAEGVVRDVRRGGAGGHRKRPRDPASCDDCEVRTVCRPDPSRDPRMGEAP